MGKTSKSKTSKNNREASEDWRDYVLTGTSWDEGYAFCEITFSGAPYSEFEDEVKFCLTFSEEHAADSFAEYLRREVLARVPHVETIERHGSIRDEVDD